MGCFVSKEREHYDKDKEQKERQFMHCVVRVDQTKKGWSKSVGKLLNSIEVREGNMRQGDELIVLSGTAVPKAVMRIISKSSKLKLERVQYGQCSALLFGPHRSTFTKKPPPAPPVEESAPPPASETGYPFPNYYPVYYYPGNYGGSYRIA